MTAFSNVFTKFAKSDFSKFVMNEEGNPITTLVVAVNGTQVDPGDKISLKEGSEVILITPMSGG